MANYVMSDIHGEADRFHAMLKKIGFSNSDMLYIIGDVIDRGPDGVALLREIIDAPNMILLMGNHEYMCVKSYSKNATLTDIQLWGCNGSRPTYEALEKLRQKEMDNILFFLEGLPDHLELTVSGVKYHLVHGFPGRSTYDRVWGRPDPNTKNPLPDCRVIVGHTPVMLLQGDDAAQQEYAMGLYIRGDHMRIYHGENFIDLDCGCGHPVIIKALSCLRLEDMAEFYT